MTSRRVDVQGIGIFFFLALISVGIVGAMVIGVKGDPQRYTELFKSCLTLIQVGGIGGFAALLLEGYKQSAADARTDAENQEAKRKLIDEQCRQLFLEARKAYDTLKRTRRLLQDRLKAEEDPSVQDLIASLQNDETVKALADHGRALFDPQLLLESLGEQAQYSNDLPQKKVLQHCFERLEKHANKVSDSLRAAAKLKEDQMKTVLDFLDKNKFREHFGKPYHEATEILLEFRKNAPQ